MKMIHSYKVNGKFIVFLYKNTQLVQVVLMVPIDLLDGYCSIQSFLVQNSSSDVLASFDVVKILALYERIQMLKVWQLQQHQRVQDEHSRTHLVMVLKRYKNQAIFSMTFRGHFRNNDSQVALLNTGSTLEWVQ